LDASAPDLPRICPESVPDRSRIGPWPALVYPGLRWFTLARLRSLSAIEQKEILTQPLHTHEALLATGGHWYEYLSSGKAMGD